MRLWAISDLHLGNAANRSALLAVPDFGDDWLILAGDVAERDAHIDQAFRVLKARFAQVIWVPGNHELWTLPSTTARGEARYGQLVALARAHGVITPEDSYPIWRGAGGPVVVVPLFLLYDYTFRPDHVSAESVLDWAMEENVLCTDEVLLHPDPHASRADWCARRCAASEARLDALDPALPTVLINHWPLRRDLVHIPRVPRFSPWCGTVSSEQYHRRYRAQTVISGHLHVRGTTLREGTVFEEVSLGYPSQWQTSRGISAYFRQVLPIAVPRAATRSSC